MSESKRSSNVSKDKDTSMHKTRKRSSKAASERTHVKYELALVWGNREIKEIIHMQTAARGSLFCEPGEAAKTPDLPRLQTYPRLEAELRVTTDPQVNGLRIVGFPIL